MGENLSWYKEILKNNGVKYTRQKEEILTELIRADRHLTAEEIHLRIKSAKIGLATVYRTLKVFVALGIVKEIPMDGLNYYELKIFSGNPLHIHFKCSACNDMIDIDDVGINLDYIKLNQKVEQSTGCEVMDANITLLGLCAACKEKQNAKTD